MKSTKPVLSMLTLFLLASLSMPTLAAGVSAIGGVNAAAPGLNATGGVDSTVTTPNADSSAMPATPADPADRMDKMTKPDSKMKSTNMRNKDCDANVSANSNSNSDSASAVGNCGDTNKPKK